MCSSMKKFTKNVLAMALGVAVLTGASTGFAVTEAAEAPQAPAYEQQQDQQNPPQMKDRKDKKGKATEAAPAETPAPAPQN